MAFNSIAFGLFLTVVFFVSWSLRRGGRAWLLFLLGASYVFYGSWNEKYLLLIVFSTALDYWVGRRIHLEEREGRRKAWLTLSIAGNLGMLGTFKYYDFFASSLVELAGGFGVSLSLPLLNVLLPVGISFYTFQTLSYTIDIYRRKLEPAESFLELALFVAFFPQLVAGPIVRAKQFLPQFHNPQDITPERLGTGLGLILKGLFKKVVIADFLGAMVVDPVFAAPGDYGAADTWLSIYCYALQLYGDFSGYTDIARGSARLLGFELPENFVAPYASRNLQDFWQRWHITLSTWLRDYLYIPLGGSRLGPVRTYVNLAMVAVVAGLWHGARWSLVTWGAMHGIGLAATRLFQRWRESRRGELPEPRGLQALVFRVLTFHYVAASMILFRGGNWDTIGAIFRGLVSGGGVPTLVTGSVAAAVAIGYGTHFTPMDWKERALHRFGDLPGWVQGTVLAATLSLFQTLSLESDPFIYFQF
ncbi:MAG: MBOAT family protein [Planctomycetota bacterium]